MASSAITVDLKVEITDDDLAVALHDCTDPEGVAAELLSENGEKHLANLVTSMIDNSLENRTEAYITSAMENGHSTLARVIIKTMLNDRQKELS